MKKLSRDKIQQWFLSQNIVTGLVIFCLSCLMFFSAHFFKNPNFFLFVAIIFLLTFALMNKPFVLLILLILTSLLPISYHSPFIADLFIFDYLIPVMLLILFFQTCLKKKISVNHLSRVEASFLLLLAVAACSIFANLGKVEEFGSIYLKTEISGLLILVFIAAVFLFVSRVVDTEKKVKSIVNLFIFLSFIVGISGLYTFFQKGVGITHGFVSLIGNYMDTSNLMFPVFNLSLSSLLLMKMGRARKWILIFLFGITLILLLQTMRRSFWAMALISILVILIFSKGPKLRIKNKFMKPRITKIGIKKVGFVLLSVICLGIILFNLASSYKLDAYLKSFISLDIGKGYSRLVIWKQSIDLFKKNSIIGSGIGSEIFFGVEESALKIIRSSGEEHSVATSHNQYLTIAIEMGIIGLILFLYFCYKLLRTTYQTYKSTNSLFFKSVTLAFFAMALATFVEILVGGAILPQHNIFRTQLYFWIWFGLVLAIKRIVNKNKNISIIKPIKVTN